MRAVSRHGHADSEPADRAVSDEARLDEAYWAQLLDEAYRLQLETADEESDVDEELEP